MSRDVRHPFLLALIAAFALGGCASSTDDATSTSADALHRCGGARCKGPSSGAAAAASPSCTTVTSDGAQIVDDQGNTWTIAGGVVMENGAPAGYSANVTELAYVGGEVYQENAAGGWWGWSGGTWVDASDPTTACGSSGGQGAPPPPSAPPPPAGGTGKFHVSGGQIIAPNGQPFLAKGINVYDTQMGQVSTDASGAPLTALFPGITIVRLNVYSYDSPDHYAAFINQLTPLGIVVELEDHTNNAGNAGGSAGTIYSGQALTDELNWFASVAAAYANNPYVWFGTDNEPSEDPSAAALSTWQRQTYDAIRGAGNDSIVLIEMNCAQDPATCGQGYDTSVYASMTNAVWDMHYYGWLVNYDTDPGNIAQSIAQHAQASQQITSADGTMPVVIGEYGPATDGTNLDADGSQVVDAVIASGYGSMAWHWDSYAPQDNLTDGNGNLTSFGQTVAQFLSK